MDAEQRLSILAEAARHDVSCSSSGSKRANSHNGLGTTSIAGICHSFADDGRCISLFKVLLSNHCDYDCAYCANRRSNDIPRAAFPVQELVDLTLAFYRRNYIEGLFLSSGISGGADATMERMIEVAKRLRQQGFNGYIHLKAIPGAAARLIASAGLLADRLSVNVELPGRESLAKLAPDKTPQAIFGPMAFIARASGFPVLPSPQWESRLPEVKPARGQSFVPAGQSTQMIVGASPDHDREILHLSQRLYRQYRLKRVYYSAYIPLNSDPRLPSASAPPLVREHRLYQADWLLRFYGFHAEELLAPNQPDLPVDLDPKSHWALQHPEFFPLDPRSAPYQDLLRVPGLGPLVARRICEARRHGRIDDSSLERMGLRWKKAGHFLYLPGTAAKQPRRLSPAELRRILQDPAWRQGTHGPRQLELFAGEGQSS